MNPNEFIPPHLSELCEATLIKTAVAYRQAYRMLASTASEQSDRIRREISQALQAIDDELQRRSHVGDTESAPAVYSTVA